MIKILKSINQKAVFMKGVGLYRLCFIKDGTAYFTSESLRAQRADDWDDAPYEHNAGLPYSNPEAPGGDVYGVRFMAPLQTPAEIFQPNSPYSVQQINRGCTPWLTDYRGLGKGVNIYAGTTIMKFLRLIEKSGGHCEPEGT